MLCSDEVDTLYLPSPVVSQGQIGDTDKRQSGYTDAEKHAEAYVADLGSALWFEKHGQAMDTDGSCQHTMHETSSMPSGGAAVGGGCEQSLREACRMTWTGATAVFQQAMHQLYLAGKEQIWQEMRQLSLEELSGEAWRNYMVKKCIELDFQLQLMTGDLYGCVGTDCGLESALQVANSFRLLMETLAYELQIQYFAHKITDGYEQLVEHEEDTNGRGSGLVGNAQGSMEDMPLDVSSLVSGRTRKRKSKVKKLHKSIEVISLRNNYADLHTRLRGGMNRFQSLEEESIGSMDETMHQELLRHGFRELSEEEEIHWQEQIASSTGDKIDTDIASNISQEQSDEPVGGLDSTSDFKEEDELNGSFHSVGSGRSFYAEYFEKKNKEALRGGAGGASTTQNKRLTAALGALAEVVKAFDESPTDEVESIENVIKQIAATVKAWTEKTPTRNEMKMQLRKFHQVLEKDSRQTVDPNERKDHSASSARQQQSFYDDFVKNFKQEEEDKNPNKWNTKGKGKGKSKTKTDGLPKFDIKKIFPAKAMTTWQLLSKE